MPSTPKPTPEEVEAARTLVANADAEADQVRRAEVIAKLKPLTDLGLGGDGKLEGSLADIAAAIRATAPNLAELDANLPTLMFAITGPMLTLNDRIRSLVALNSPAASEA